MPLGGQHLGDNEPLEPLGGVFDALNFKPDAVARIGDFVDARLCVEMRLEP